MDSIYYANPYSSKTFFSFIAEFLFRLWAFFTGSIGISDLASDEIQIIVLVGVTVSSALVGTFLVLRKMTMLANSLSHTILLGIVIAYLLTSGSLLTHGQPGEHSGGINIQAMLIASLAMGFVTTFLTEALTKYARLQEDASTGLVFTSLFALGIILVTVLTRSAHVGTEVVMGNVDALQLSDCSLVYIVLGINVILFTLFFKEFKITTFDSNLAASMGFSVVFFNYLLMAQVSITAISAFRAVGVLMVLALITGPPLTALLLSHDLKRVLLIAVSIGCFAAFVGVALSRHILTVYGIALSTTGIVVCVIAAIYAFVCIGYFYRREIYQMKINSALE